MIDGQQTILLEQFFDMMLAERGAGKATISAYKTDLHDLAFFLKQYHQKSLINAHYHDLQDYLANIVKRNMTVTTQARRLSSLKQFYRFLFLEKLRDDNPSKLLSHPKTTRNIPKSLSIDDVNQLLETSANMTGIDGIRLHCLLCLLYATGMRVSELVSLPYHIVNAEDYFIIKGKGGKERIIPLSPIAQAAIKKYHDNFLKKTYHGQDKPKYFFPSDSAQGYLTRQRVGQLLKSLAIQANIDARKLSPHILRHAFASHLLHNGANLRILQTLLGHSDISTTQIYTHVRQEKLNQIVKNTHPLA